MPAPISLVPPRPGDGSGICEPRETEQARPGPTERLRPCKTEDCNADLPPEYDHEYCPYCRDDLEGYDAE